MCLRIHSAVVFDLASVVFLVKWARPLSIRYEGSALPSFPSAALLAVSSACSFLNTSVGRGPPKVMVLSQLVRLLTISIAAFANA